MPASHFHCCEKNCAITCVMRKILHSPMIYHYVVKMIKAIYFYLFKIGTYSFGIFWILTSIHPPLVSLNHTWGKIIEHRITNYIHMSTTLNLGRTPHRNFLFVHIWKLCKPECLPHVVCSLLVIQRAYHASTF